MKTTHLLLKGILALTFLIALPPTLHSRPENVSDQEPQDTRAKSGEKVEQDASVPSKVMNEKMFPTPPSPPGKTLSCNAPADCFFGSFCYRETCQSCTPSPAPSGRELLHHDDVYCREGFCIQASTTEATDCSNINRTPSNAAPISSVLASWPYTKISGGPYHTVAVKADGSAWGWGCGWGGWLQDRCGTTRRRPVQIPEMTEVTDISPSLAGDDDFYSCVLKRNGTVWRVREIVGSLPVQAPGLTNVTAIFAPQYFSCLALKADGSVWSWRAPNTPVQVPGLTNVIAIGGDPDYYFLKRDGTVWQFPRFNQFFSGPVVQVPGLTDVIAISSTAAPYRLALQRDGTVWAWGDNHHGQLGDGTTTNRTTPVQVLGLTGVTDIQSGFCHSLALQRDGTVWAWGCNDFVFGFHLFGQLGDGTTVHRSTPVQVSGLTGVTSIGTGAWSSFAIKGDGTVWAWGGNQHGQLGDGTTTNRTTPVQILGVR